jgi:hypothetical protein
MNTPASRSTNDPAKGPSRLELAIESLAKIPKVALVSVFGPFLLLVAGYLLWVNYGAKHLNTSLYGVLAENIIVTPQPAWIPTPILPEVFQQSDLGRLSTLDRQMSAAVYNAFRLHPWIRRVFRVQPLAGAQVQVDVEYREPLAMVYCETSIKIESNKSRDGNRLPKPVSTPIQDRAISFLPVDADAVLLPTKDFRPEQVPQYMLIYAQSAEPSGLIGSEYGDSRIKEALLLCKLLKDVRETMGIERVYVYSDPASEGPSRWTLEITTKSKKIRWGHPPGMESPGEPGFPAKLRKLGDFLLRPSPSETTQTEYDLVASAKPTLGNLLKPAP